MLGRRVGENRMNQGGKEGRGGEREGGGTDIKESGRKSDERRRKMRKIKGRKKEKIGTK